MNYILVDVTYKRISGEQVTHKEYKMRKKIDWIEVGYQFVMYLTLAIFLGGFIFAMWVILK